MIHIARGEDRASAHSHDTVAEAKACEVAHDEAYNELARQEVWAENAWLRAAEYSPRVNEEDRQEWELESWLQGVHSGPAS